MSSRDFLEIAESSSNSEHKQYDDSRENNWIDNKNSTDYEFSSLFIPKANTSKSISIIFKLKLPKHQNFSLCKEEKEKWF